MDFLGEFSKPRPLEGELPPSLHQLLHEEDPDHIQLIWELDYDALPESSGVGVAILFFRYFWVRSIGDWKHEDRSGQVWTMKELCSSRELHEEGRAMHHCVGGG